MRGARSLHETDALAEVERFYATIPGDTAAAELVSAQHMQLKQAMEELQATAQAQAAAWARVLALAHAQLPAVLHPCTAAGLHKVLEKAIDVALELEQIQLLASLAQVQAHARSEADAQARADALIDALATQKKDETVVHTRGKIKIVFLRHQMRRSSSTSSMRSWTSCT